MKPYFMCKPRHCRQEMHRGLKKNVVVTSFMLREFSKLFLSTQSRGHHRVNIVVLSLSQLENWIKSSNRGDSHGHARMSFHRKYVCKYKKKLQWA